MTFPVALASSIVLVVGFHRKALATMDEEDPFDFAASQEELNEPSQCSGGNNSKPGKAAVVKKEFGVCVACPEPADAGVVCKTHKRAYECMANDAFPRTKKAKLAPDLESKQTDFNAIFGPTDRRDLTSTVAICCMVDFVSNFPEGPPGNRKKRGPADFTKYVRKEGFSSSVMQQGLARPLDFESFVTRMKNVRG